MTDWPVYATVTGPIVMVGFGSIGKGTLPLIERHLNYDKSRITVLDPKDEGRKALLREARRALHPAGPDEGQLSRRADAAAHRGRRPGLLRQPFGRHAARSTSWSSATNSARSTSTRSTSRGSASISTPRREPAARSNYALREATLAAKKARRPGSTTAVSCCGANPGMVSFFVKQALLNVASDLKLNAHEPKTKAEWADLMRQTGVKGIHIAERDTQRSKSPKPPEVFVNTWSVEGFLSEGMQPAELGWGTHEKWMPANAHTHETRQRRGDLPDAARRQHARAHLVPDARRAVRLPRHPQRVDLDLRLFHGARRIGRGDLPADLPLCLSPGGRRGAVAARDVRLRARCRRSTTSSTRTKSSTASTNSVCCSTATARMPIGSARSSRSRRRGKLAPYQNATGLQVTSAVLGGMVWALEHPNEGIVEADEMDFHRLPGNPAALSRAGDREVHRLDAAGRPAGAVSGGHGHIRPLAVQQRAGLIGLFGTESRSLPNKRLDL